MTPTGPEPVSQGEPPVYTVRFSPHAEGEAAEATVRLAELTGDPARGHDWYVGLRAAAGTLATNPRRYVRVPGPQGARFRREVHRMIYRPAGGKTGPVYLVLYAIEDDTLDGPLVSILSVRHAARKSLTREEARSIEAGEDSPNP